MKKSILTRILAILFAAIMLISVVACTKDPDKDKESQKPGESDPVTPQDSESQTEVETERDFATENFHNGATYTIFAYRRAGGSWGAIPADIYLAEDAGDILSSAVYQRGLVIKDNLGVQLEVVEMQNGHTGELLRDINDGEYRYQLTTVLTNDLGTVVNNGSITSVNKAGIDLNYPWFDKQTVDLLTVKGKTVALSTDITYLDKLSTIAFYYNKQMVKDNQFGDLYKMVNDKTWTFDNMLTMAESVVPTVDADGAHTVEDTYGITCQNDGGYFFYHASGLTAVSRKADGGLVNSFNTEDAVNVLEKVLKLMADRRVYLNTQHAETTLGAADAAEHFASGKSLFFVRPLQSLFDLSKITDNYGILPFPLMFEGQEQYYSPVNTHTSTHMCFPARPAGEDYVMTNDVVQWLGSYSRKNLVPVFYEVVLGSRMSMDPDSPKMLDIIFSTRNWDFGYIWNVTNVREVLTNKIGKASITEGTVKTHIDEYIDAMNTMIGALETTLGGLE